MILPAFGIVSAIDAVWNTRTSQGAIACPVSLVVVSVSSVVPAVVVAGPVVDPPVVPAVDPLELVAPEVGVAVIAVISPPVESSELDAALSGSSELPSPESPQPSAANTTTSVKVVCVIRDFTLAPYRGDRVSGSACFYMS